MKKYIFSCICILCLSLSGCDYLDTEPGDAISSDRFWETSNAAALEQYCNLYYPKLIKGHGDPLSWNIGNMIMQEYQSDNLLAAGASSITFGQNTVMTSSADWDWSTVRGCNAFLENYEKSPASDIDKKKFAGEILFFKAFDYFNKVCLFGEVPWYDSTLNKDNPELYKGRDSRDLVMTNILATINKAIEFLPRKTKVYRVSRDAALLLKARICLYEGTWRRYRNVEGDVKFLEEAYKASGELMGYGYELYKASGTDDSYFDLFIQDNYNDNSEVILSREYDPALNMGHNEPNSIPNSEQGMSRDCFEEYLCANTGKPISLCGCHNPNMGYNAEMKNRDGRLLQTVCLPESGSKYARFLYRTTGGLLKGGAPNIFSILPNSDTRTFYAASCTGYSVCKFYKASEHYVGNHKGGIDAPVMRYAEVLLTYAEARIQTKGWDAEVQKALNDLRDRCGMPDVPTSLSKEEGLELIANERRIELAAEGFRSDDMYRYSDEYWNKHINNVEIAAPDGDNIITMSWNPRMHLRPIPQTAIDLNPLLADDQNPGY